MIFSSSKTALLYKMFRLAADKRGQQLYRVCCAIDGDLTASPAVTKEFAIEAHTKLSGLNPGRHYHIEPDPTLASLMGERI